MTLTLTHGQPKRMQRFYILAEAITNAQSTDSLAIRDALASIMDFDTVLGQFSFNVDGDAVYDLIILTVENGELVVFE